MAQEIFAKIKRNSKYYGQTAPGLAFAVFIEAGNPDAYLVKGGPGGQYRLKDVNLFVIDENHQEVRIA